MWQKLQEPKYYNKSQTYLSLLQKPTKINPNQRYMEVMVQFLDAIIETGTQDSTLGVNLQNMNNNYHSKLCQQ